MSSFKRYSHSSRKRTFHKNALKILAAKLKKTSRRKRISFSVGENSVRHVRVPPKNENSRYWFTRTVGIAKKGRLFEVKPLKNEIITVNSRCQICTIAKLPDGLALHHCDGDREPEKVKNTNSVAKKDKSLPFSSRSYLSVLCKSSDSPLGYLNSMSEKGKGFFLTDTSDGCPASSWLTMGSVCPGQMQRLRVILPAGLYELRCEGDSDPVQVFAQDWDFEEKLT